MFNRNSTTPAQPSAPATATSAAVAAAAAANRKASDPKGRVPYNTQGTHRTATGAAVANAGGLPSANLNNRE